MGNNIVVIAEQADGQIRPVTYEIISFAKKLQHTTRSNPIKVFLLADEVENLAQELAEKSGLDVMAVQVPEMEGYNGELYLRVLTEFISDIQPGFVCIAHTSQGLDYAPALAVKLNAACITGVGGFFDQAGVVSFTRPIYGGKIIAHLQPLSRTSILTIQPGFFKTAGNSQGSKGNITRLSTSAGNRQSRSLGIKQADTDTAGISEASVIVAAGRGIGEKENLDFIHQLAALFTKSAVAGSRLVCDLGWLGYRRQVGVTGTTVAPQLYIACGISGAVQHVMGMQSSEFIVAINKDPSAAIFQTADICIIEDLTAFIPAFIRAYNDTGGKNGKFFSGK
jgi:electron transfer flavoprotein alpha subunit